jgi:hypothetical protein
MQGRVIVIGASADGIGAISKVLSGLPATFVAPPTAHVVIRHRAIYPSDGPEENFCRPAVDVLFRSAALDHVLAVESLEDHIAGGDAPQAEIRGLIAASRAGDLACPMCDQPLDELPDLHIHRFRCGVGHAITHASLDAQIDAPLRAS